MVFRGTSLICVKLYFYLVISQRLSHSLSNAQIELYLWCNNAIIQSTRETDLQGETLRMRKAKSNVSGYFENILTLTTL